MWKKLIIHFLNRSIHSPIRWRQIYNMVKFRNIVANEPVQNWMAHTEDAISFGRGNKGFIVMNTGHDNLRLKSLATGLPAGKYCEVITGNIESKTMENFLPRQSER